MCGVEVVKDKATKEWFPADFGLGAKLTNAMLDRGLTTRVRSEVICLAPPLNTDESILDDIVDLADEQKVTIRQISRGRFDAMARTEGAQGVLATAAPLRPVELDDLLGDDGGKPFLLLLDGITDPGNLGAILRTAECAGVTGVVLPRHRAAHVTPTVAKAAAGIEKSGGIHSLRHAYACHQLEAGLPIYQLQRLLGHQSIKSTLRYVHWRPNDPEVRGPQDLIGALPGQEVSHG